MSHKRIDEITSLVRCEHETIPSDFLRMLFETKCIHAMPREEILRILHREIKEEELNRISYSIMNKVLHILPHVVLYKETEHMDECNAEHVFPQSYFMSEHELKTDLHHIFACDKFVNCTRANFKFEQIPGIINEYRVSSHDHKFNPPIESKGVVARAMAYIICGYPNSLHFSDIINTDTIVIWNMLCPVTEEERQRNNIIEKIQGNRNPFIDFPDLINILYGDHPISLTVNGILREYVPTHLIAEGETEKTEK